MATRLASNQPLGPSALSHLELLVDTVAAVHTVAPHASLPAALEADHTLLSSLCEEDASELFSTSTVLFGPDVRRQARPVSGVCAGHLVRAACDASVVHPRQPGDGHPPPVPRGGCGRAGSPYILTTWALWLHQVPLGPVTVDDLRQQRLGLSRELERQRDQLASLHGAVGRAAPGVGRAAVCRSQP